MDLLEASARLERIELLAKITHFDEITSKEKTVALEWIGEIAIELREAVQKEVQNPHCGGVSRGRCGFQ